MPLSGPVLSRARPTRLDSLSVLVEAFSESGARRVIDLGCGTGALAAQLAAAGFDVTGADPRADAIKAARLAAPAARFIQSGAENVPLHHGPFDAACMVNSLHHIAPELMRPALLHAVSLLRPGGDLLVIEPVAGGSFFRCMKPVDDETQVRAHAIDAIDDLLSRGALLRRDVRRWDRVSRFASLQGFIDYLLDVDPQRASAIETHRSELARAWRDNIQVENGLAMLTQPICCWTLSGPPK